MALIQEFSSLACAILLFFALCFLIKIYCIILTNQKARVEKNQPQQSIVNMRCSVTRDEEGNQNQSVQRNRQFPREHDERQGY